MVEVESNNALILTLAIGGAIVAFILYFLRAAKSEEENEQQKSADRKPQNNGAAKNTEESKQISKKKQNHPRSELKAVAFSHPWLYTSLKGHSSTILSMDFSSNGKYLISCSDDRSVFLWPSKDFSNKEHKSLRINIEFDHATKVTWSPDSKAFIIHKSVENCVEVYKLNKKSDGHGFSGSTKLTTFPKHHIDEVIAMGISCNGKFIMTCSKSTDLVLWDLKGQIIANVDTYLMSNNCGRVSPCGRYIAASGFAPDVKVWEVVFNKSGDFQAVNRAFELQGHKSGVLDFAFNCDSTRVATLSKDGSWRVFDTKIDYKKGEDPRLIQSGKFELASQEGNHIAISPEGHLIVCSTGTKISFYSVESGKCEGSIQDVHSGPITSLLFDSSGDQLLTSGDRHIRVFHNIVGFKLKLASLKASLKSNLSSAMKDRIQDQISQTEKFLVKFKN
ncbi:Hypothetical predicted protein [Cloeon dipterum]|uniref:Uncharacterized protein n=1 Tax=Cloeon dipterum TaxID=197152 RepID=A0A8S1C6U6_9INSE|nr:Hypothetical predicted protein [Cloeon dipterum]